MSAIDVQSQLQSEVQEMRRKLRIMENDKKAYMEESEQMLKR